VGRWEVAGRSFSSRPSTVNNLVILVKPSSAERPFSSASSVARLTPALRDRAGLAEFQSPSALSEGLKI